MASFSCNTTPTITTLNVAQSPPSYASIIDRFNLPYKSSEYYWKVGKPIFIRSWVINLSAIKIQLPKLLEAVIPVLAHLNYPFNVIRDESMAEYALNGHLGHSYLGKMISIYPPTPQDALSIAKKLISITKSFKGPAIRTDRCLGGIVYTNFGDHITVPFSMPPHIEWPFSEIAPAQIPPKSKLLNFSYYPASILKCDAKGDVIRALYFRKIWQIKSCIIKQGRQNMFMDAAGRDIRDRLKWQYELHAQLAFHYHSLSGLG